MKAELDARRPFSAAELRRMREEFAVEYTYNSNAIEGNTLTLRETALVLEGLTIDKKPLKDHLEAVGHKEAFDYRAQGGFRLCAFARAGAGACFGARHKRNTLARADGQAGGTRTLAAHSGAHPRRVKHAAGAARRRSP